MKKILYFTKYTRKGASSRLRSFQYIPYLEEAGYRVEVFPLFDDRYLTDLYKGQKSLSNIWSAYRRRFSDLKKAKEGDTVFIEYELFPYLPAWAEMWLRRKKINYIVDYDDAIFHNYDKSSNAIVRFLLGNKIPRVMRNSSLVIAGNQYLAEKAKRSGAKRVEKIPTVVDLERYQMKERFSSQNEPLVIGWIGTFSTFKYVKSLLPVFEKLAEKIPLKLHIIGAKEDLDTFLEIKFIDWEEHLEASSIRTFDVGIMPLKDSPWEKGKCGYKLIQYMASGIPVIASPVGVNSEIVENNINGYLAKTVQDWEDKILYLHENRNLLQLLGAAGRKKVEETYSLQVTSNKLLQIVDGFNI